MYCKENCRWASSHEQAINRRTISSIEYHGVEKNMKDWAKTLGINYQTLHGRLTRYGYSVEKAFEQPISAHLIGNTHKKPKYGK